MKDVDPNVINSNKRWMNEMLFNFPNLRKFNLSSNNAIND
jgi:hypothetical protein